MSKEIRLNFCDDFENNKIDKRIIAAVDYQMGFLFVNKRNCALFLISFLYGILFTGSSSFSNEIKAKDFQRQYRQYQGQVRAGRTSIKKKQYAEAIKYYTKAIEASPFVASHYYYRGLAWYRKGNEDKAIEDFHNVIILDPRWRSAYIYRGLCRMKGGEYKGALSDYKSALKMNPKDPSVHNNLAWLYAMAKDEKFRDKGKALEHAKKAAELSKERNAEILDTLARAYFVNGKIKEALETESKTLKLAPNNEGFKENLKIYQKAMKE